MLLEFDAAEKVVKERIAKLFAIRKEISRFYSRKLGGRLYWEYVGMSRTEAGLKPAIEEIKKLKMNSGVTYMLRHKMMAF